MAEHKVFISYSRSDADWAQKFARSLQDVGLPVWLDKFEITPGTPWQEGLEAALRGSDVFAFLIHPEKLDSPLLSFELGVAMSLKKMIVPVVPQNLEPYSLPFPLRDIQSLERTSPEETAQKFANAVDSLYRKAA